MSAIKSPRLTSPPNLRQVLDLKPDLIVYDPKPCAASGARVTTMLAERAWGVMQTDVTPGDYMVQLRPELHRRARSSGPVHPWAEQLAGVARHDGDDAVCRPPITTQASKVAGMHRTCGRVASRFASRPSRKATFLSRRRSSERYHVERPVPPEGAAGRIASLDLVGFSVGIGGRLLRGSAGWGLRVRGGNCGSRAGWLGGRSRRCLPSDRRRSARIEAALGEA